MCIRDSAKSVLRRRPDEAKGDLSPSKTLRNTRTSSRMSRVTPVYSVLNDPSDPHAPSRSGPRSSRRANPEVRGTLTHDAPEEPLSSGHASRLSLPFRK